LFFDWDDDLRGRATMFPSTHTHTHTVYFTNFLSPVILPERRKCEYLCVLSDWWYCWHTCTIFIIICFYFLSITNKTQRYTTFFVTVNALHVSDGFSAHHQELKNCTHSIGYMSSMLAATASVVELEQLVLASGSNKQA